MLSSISDDIKIISVKGVIMNYASFIKHLYDDYVDIYEKGLRKEANKSIQEFFLTFDKINQDEQDKLFYKFCEDYCDNNVEQVTKLSERGNGAIPYELAKRILLYLQKCYEKDLMPQVRWYYEMAYDIGVKSIDPSEVIGKAYNHKDRDQKSINLMFSSKVGTLSWGSHHFPEGCIIGKEVVDETIKTANEMITKHEIKDEIKHEINDELKDEFYNYCKLYELWWEFEKNDHTDFTDFCAENGLKFNEIKAYYYDR